MSTLNLPGADGVKISVQESGDPEAPPVMLLHALGHTAGDWGTVAAALAPDFRVFAVDLRGHGGSGRRGQYSLELIHQHRHRMAAGARTLRRQPRLPGRLSEERRTLVR